MISILGIIVILLTAYLFSNDRRNIPLRTVSLAFTLQITFAFIVLYFPAGKDALNGFSAGVSNVIDYGQEGISFLFGSLVQGGFVFAINVLGIIVFFSALISALYHIGFMPKVINIVGGGLQKLLGTGRAESLAATANIFVGMVESPLLIKPHLRTLSNSELFMLMSCGMATVAGTVL